MKIGYSLWLIPDKVSADALSTLIKDLAKRYHTPEFDPHLTVIGLSFLREKASIQAVQKLAKTRPLILNLSLVDYSTTYFQCLFARAEPTPQLMDLYLSTEKIFKIEHKMYMPHLSLLYGDLDMVTRHNLAHSIMLPISTVTLDSLTVVKFDLDNMDPATWKPIKRFPLQ